MMNTSCQSIRTNHEDNNTNIEETTIISYLKDWSGKDNYSIIFDSDVDGNGTNNTILHKIYRKSNLFFIHFDYYDNVFGGYINSTINKIDIWIQDSNAFLFSLVRNGKMKNKKYSIQTDYQQQAFFLYDKFNRLYCFGKGTSDILVESVNKFGSWFYQHSYSYNDEENPLVNQYYPSEFKIQRILIIQMS